MSSPILPLSEPEADPFRYGWRYVRQQREDGVEELVQTPLTLADVLHPREGDTIPENTLHERLRRHFHNVFERLLSDDPCKLSLSDCLIDWGRPEVGNHGPDLAVLQRDLPWPWRHWGTLRLEEEQARPLLVLEIVSPHTRDNDVIEKVREYHDLGIPLYVLVDQQVEGGPLELLGYCWAASGWETLALNERGRLLVEPLGLELAVEQDRVAIFEAATGRELGDYTAVCSQLEKEVQARAEAEKRAEQEARARQAAEEEKRGAEKDKRQAEKDKRQAEKDKRQAEKDKRQAEKAARQEVAARQVAEKQNAALTEQVRVLQEQLQRLQGKPGE